MNKKRLAWGGYAFALHVAIAGVLWRPDAVPRIEQRLGLRSASGEALRYITWMRKSHARLDPNVPAGSTIFLGDSITQALATIRVVTNDVNLGIGSQTSADLLKSMAAYGSLDRASTIVVMIGTNDLALGLEDGIEERYKQILARLPTGAHVVLNSVPPLHFPGVSDLRVQAVRDAARRACAADQRCSFLDTYGLISRVGPAAFLRDGVHLSPAGYDAWIAGLRGMLGSSTDTCASRG